MKGKTRTKETTFDVPLPKLAADLMKANGTLSRVSVNKAYKMYVGGAFVRSESGRSFQVKADAGNPGKPDPDVVNIPRASRKDVRDAVLAARNAHAGWAARTPYNRGQILYRLAEMMESRWVELTTSLSRSQKADSEACAEEVSKAIDTCVYYAGLTDKISSLLASHNPVAGPHFGFTLPESLGVVGVVAPEVPILLGLVTSVLPAVCGGNSVVALASECDPRTASIWTECVATSDMPGGVINVLFGHVGEVLPTLSKHRDVNGLALWLDDTALVRSATMDAADSVKRVRTYAGLAKDLLKDASKTCKLSLVEPHLEFKTVWHPMGL